MRGWGHEIGESFSLAWELALPTMMGAALGWVVDERFAWSPWGLVVGLFSGASAALWLASRRFRLQGKEKERTDDM